MKNKPCPFCKRQNKLIEIIRLYGEDDNEIVTIECEKCLVSAPQNIWNGRGKTTEYQRVLRLVV